ncbi:MAG: hypothetical protein CMH64_00915 [Nanoarchaeota archaeon]|nr:hypothetical protein [Nanoarchaeota archaeon]
MIIKKIKLENIRSYLQEEVIFPENSLLLSGDVGSGKSSILLSIDFALFGLTRGILSGGSLLRNGAKEGGVELHLDINGKEIVIRRNLKRNEKSVTQDSGYILTNGAKEEGSAVELKAKVLELLNYPKDLLTKSKSLIYRFTVYTPQEEMKRILLEDAEERLEILRRVFDIDKYKRIQENCSLISRKLKEQIREGDILVGGLEEKKIEKSKLENEILDYRKELEHVNNDETIVKNKLEETKKAIEEYENRIKKLSELRNELNIVNNNMEYRTNEKKRVEEELKKIEEDIVNGEELIKDFKKDFEIEAGEKIEDLEENILLKEEKLTKIRGKLSEFNLMIRTSEDLIVKVKDLDNCPTCFQIVTNEHKNNMTNTENEKLSTVKNNVEIFSNNEEELNREIDLAKEKLTGLQNSLNEFRVMKVKVEGLNDKKNLRENLENELSKMLDSFGEFNEKQKKLEFEIEENKQFEEKYKSGKQEMDDLNDKLRNCEVKVASLNEKITGVDNTVRRLDDEIIEKVKIRERSEKLNGLLKWVSEQFLIMVEKMERSVMLRLHNDFNSLFQKWVGILIDNENLSVKLDNEFTPKVIQDGYDTEYEFLSGGEKTAIALAYRLSLNQVINNLMSLIETKDVIILDEPTDGFSNEQLDRVRVVLDELEIKQVIIVSHEDKIESFVDNVLRFEKQGHVSKVLR